MPQGESVPGPSRLRVHTKVHTVRYEWDAFKAALKRTKHGIDFADAVTALEDPLALTMLDDAGMEDRFATLGTAADGELLVVVHVWPSEDRARIVSARPATHRERRQYQDER